jgi:hypothetical protein
MMRSLHQTLGRRRVDRVLTTPEVVPAEVVANAKAAFSHRVQGKIAFLERDSAPDEGASA